MVLATPLLSLRVAITKEQLDRRVEGQTVCSRFLDRVDADPNRVALRTFVEDDPGRGKAETWTWSEYADHVARAAAGLRMLGVGPGDRVVLLLRNIPRFHFVDLAVNFLGATSVSVHVTAEPEEVGAVATDCGAKVAVVEDAELLERVLIARDEVRDRLGDTVSELRCVLLLDNPLGLRSPGVLDGVEILEGQRALKLHDEVDNADPDDPATMLYAETGESPTGIELSHRDLVRTAAAYAEVLDGDTVGLRAISYLPMSHVAERMAGHYLALVAGLEVTTCPWPDDLPAYLRAVRPEVLFGVPRVWEVIRADIEATLADDADAQETFDDALAKAVPIAERQETGDDTSDDEIAWAELDEDAFRLVRKRAGLNALKRAVTGAAPIPAELIGWYRAIGVPLAELDGLAEAAGSVDGALPDCEALLGADVDALFGDLDDDDSDDLA